MGKLATLLIAILGSMSCTAHSARLGDSAQFGTPPSGAPEMRVAKTAMEPAPDPDRKVVYAGSYALTVSNVAQAMSELEALVERMAGTIQQSTLSQIVFRVPPDRFREAMDAVSRIGEVTDRKISSAEVTGEYKDLELRIAAAEKSRQRLMDLVERAKETKDLLETEREIRRLTEEIESMKGALAVLGDRVSMATITVALAPRLQDQRNVVRRDTSLRFAYLFDRIGLSNALREFRSRKVRLIFGQSFRLDVPRGRSVPPSFVPIWRWYSGLYASSAEDYRLKVDTIDLRARNGLGFWSDTVSNELKAWGHDVSPTQDFEMASPRLSAKRIATETVFGGEMWRYDLWLVMDGGDESQVLAIEYARLSRDADKYTEEVEAAVRGMRW